MTEEDTADTNGGNDADNGQDSALREKRENQARSLLMGVAAALSVLLIAMLVVAFTEPTTTRPIVVQEHLTVVHQYPDHVIVDSSTESQDAAAGDDALRQCTDASGTWSDANAAAREAVENSYDQDARLWVKVIVHESETAIRAVQQMVAMGCITPSHGAALIDESYRLWMEADYWVDEPYGYQGPPASVLPQD